MHFRQYVRSDQEEVLRLHRLALRDVHADAGDGPWDADLADIEGHYLKAGGEFLVGELGGRIISMGALLRVSPATGEIKRIRVHPDYQRQGFGTALLRLLESRAAEFGFAELVLHTTTRQTAALAFYVHHGYEPYDRRLDGALEIVFMHKPLTSDA